ncbi:MAG: hypothetical protein B6D78_04225 [gamma proteobacterium symbiont of Ctena orbiculata]|nr:MAG: hypothetical protein B6D78_04225 [gamma proteobacterium symbiont of Ctena orbiculata]PVV26963.1 MAG: hypothetical protein B6D79_04615 [gamma proteobacterium symbiont of Ctena orbiculata]
MSRYQQHLLSLKGPNAVYVGIGEGPPLLFTHYTCASHKLKRIENIRSLFLLGPDYFERSIMAGIRCGVIGTAIATRNYKGAL